MNIQSINQNRQQNFGMNFEVVTKPYHAPKMKRKLVAEAKRILQELNQQISPNLRGDLTMAMRNAEGRTVYLHPIKASDSFLMSASKENAALDIEFTIFPPANTKKFAEMVGYKLLGFIQELASIPEAAKTKTALAKEIKFTK